MACFIVPAAEAIVTAAVKKGVKKSEERHAETEFEEVSVSRIPMSVKLRWLTWLLLGGAVLLAFEHVWHGEVVPYFPFLTAMSDPQDAAEMFHEMGTVGVCMAAVITVVWGGICVTADAILRRTVRKTQKI